VQPKMKALAVTLALATVVTAAACGDDDSPDAATADRSSAEAVAPADVAGSDQHLNNAAEEVARQERVNAAATAKLAAEAERQAHLDGQAQLYANLSADAASGLADEQSAYEAGASSDVAAAYGDEQRQPGTDAAPNAFEAGNRAAAEAIERQAHLDGQAQTYGGDQ
jgi:hypothetical protein